MTVYLPPARASAKPQAAGPLWAAKAAGDSCGVAIFGIKSVLQLANTIGLSMGGTPQGGRRGTCTTVTHLSSECGVLGTLCKGWLDSFIWFFFQRIIHAE